MLEILHSFVCGVMFLAGIAVGIIVVLNKSKGTKSLEMELRKHREACEDRLASSAASNFRAAQALERIADNQEGGAV